MMKQNKWKRSACCMIAGLIVSSVQVHARQNIVIGDLSIGYEGWDRSNDTRSLPEPSDPEESAPEVILVEAAGEGNNRYFVEPRLTFLSTGITDQISLTYAPRINFEEQNSTDHLDHEFGLQVDKEFSRAWAMALGNTFFLGDDALRESTTRTSSIGGPNDSGAGEEETALPEPESDTLGLTERVGSRRFWRNDLTLSTDYGYREGSNIEGRLSYGLLRNVDDDDGGGYTEYDRYDAGLTVSHQFTRQWLAELGGVFTRGIFDDASDIRVILIRPEEEEVEDITVTGAGSDDLTSYDVNSQVNYSWDVQNNLFVNYHFLATEYDHPLRDDSWVHEVALGWDHDFSRHLHLSLSGGPSFAKRENSSWETDVVASFSLSKAFLHSSLSLYGSKAYDQQDFDGRRSGLTDSWQVGADYSYQFTENLTGTVSAGYSNNKREQPPAVDAVVIVEGEGNAPDRALAPEGFEYTDEYYDAGLDLSYTFLRWYTVSGGYRYAKRESDLAGSSNYDEHRFFITLTASKELFRW